MKKALYLHAALLATFGVFGLQAKKQKRSKPEVISLAQARELASKNYKFDKEIDETALDVVVDTSGTFYDSAQMKVLKHLEKNWKTIQKELMATMKEQWPCWPQADMYNKSVKDGWNVFGLYAFGKQIGDNCIRCPKTTKMLEKIPGLSVAIFSRLKPGTHIKPHIGPVPDQLTVHLGLIVPDKCGIRVGPKDNIKGWQEGKLIAFDDTKIHEAWNRSDKERVVLLLQVKKSDLIKN